MKDISTQEAAELLGMTRQRVGQLIHKNLLPARRDEVGAWRLDLADVFRLAVRREKPGSGARHHRPGVIEVMRQPPDA